MRMEKKKIDCYSAGYSVPAPFEIGRWYEKTSQEDIDEFNRKEEEQRSNWTKNNPKEKNQDEDDAFMGDMAYFFALLRGDS